MFQKDQSITYDIGGVLKPGAGSGFRSILKDKNRIVIKIGSSSLIHSETGGIDYVRLEKLVRIISDLKNQDKDVILVSSGAIGVGYKNLGLPKKPDTLALKQACAAVGQGQLMMIYQKLFLEYNHKAAQVLLTFDVITSDERIRHVVTQAQYYVNENDTVATEEIEFGDNDTLSAIVASLIDADLLILLTDIDGLYTDDPHITPDAERISVVKKIDSKLISMAKGATSSVGTGGMATKIAAARIATDTGTDMVICNSNDLDNITAILEGENLGTLFISHEQEDFDTTDFIINKRYME